MEGFLEAARQCRDQKQEMISSECFQELRSFAIQGNDRFFQ